MTAAGAVLDVAGLPLPGDADTLTLAPVPRDVFDRLMHEHPPTGDGDLVDIAGLGPHLLAAAAVAPALTVDEAREVLDEWPAGDVDVVLEQAFALCVPEPVERAWWRLERDVALRLEMDYCAPHGLPHSHFLGGPAGWTGHDRELALAWLMRRNATCPGCGTRPDEWQRDPYAYVPTPVLDKGCEVLKGAESQLEDRDREAGTRIVLVPFAQADAEDDDGDADGGDG